MENFIKDKKTLIKDFRNHQRKLFFNHIASGIKAGVNFIKGLFGDGGEAERKRREKEYNDLKNQYSKETGHLKNINEPYISNMNFYKEGIK